MSQYTDFRVMAGKDGRWHVELCRRLLQQAAAAPTQRRFALWLREQKITDRPFLQFLLKLLDIRIGARVALGEAGRELVEEAGRAPADAGVPPPGGAAAAASPVEVDPFRQLLYDRMIELNGYLARFVFDEMGEGFLAPHEMFRRIGMVSYRGERPSMAQLEAWLKWMEWLGMMRTVGFRKQLTPRGRENWQAIKDVPVEELLGGAGALGVLAGLAEQDEEPGESVREAAEGEPPPEAPPEPAYLVAADLPPGTAVPVAEPPGARAQPAAVAAPAAGEPVEEQDEEEPPDFGPEHEPPPLADTGATPVRADEARPLSEEEREAIRELLGEQALAELEEQPPLRPDAAPAPAPAAPAAASEPAAPVRSPSAEEAVRASMDELAAATEALLGSLGGTGGQASTAVSAAAGGESGSSPPRAPAAARAQAAVAAGPPAASGGGDALRGAPGPPAPARTASPAAEAVVAAPAPIPAAAAAATDGLAQRAEIIAALWEMEPGRAPLSAADLGVSPAQPGYALFQLALLAALLEGAEPPPGALGLYRTLDAVGAVRGLFSGSLTVDQVLTPAEDEGAPGPPDNPHGRAIERLVYVPWLRRACTDRAVLERLRRNPARRAAELRALSGGALGRGAYWVEREMRRLGLWE
ncbi:MAG: hypothetical protein KatS3mg102_0266 [Planctomycetota bacterium]|nr:MAG: hypothetical protein KatS3mg102_0266 [Planctomycetota bacterium]